MAQQLDLRALMGGKRQSLPPEPPKRKPGRPRLEDMLEDNAPHNSVACTPRASRLRRISAASTPAATLRHTSATPTPGTSSRPRTSGQLVMTPVPDEAVDPVDSSTDQGLLRGWAQTPRRYSLGKPKEDPEAQLVALVGPDIASALPHDSKRVRLNEGPQRKLQVCEWIESAIAGMGQEHIELIVCNAARQWLRFPHEIRDIWKNKAKWQQQCAERGCSASGATPVDAHLPIYLRDGRRSHGKIHRASGR